MYNYSSGAVEDAVQEQANLQAINTNNINTDSINNKGIITLEEIKVKNKLDELAKKKI